MLESADGRANLYGARSPKTSIKDCLVYNAFKPGAIIYRAQINPPEGNLDLGTVVSTATWYYSRSDTAVPCALCPAPCALSIYRYI